MSYATGTLKGFFSPSGELVPAEAKARMNREGRKFLRKSSVSGTTIDQEGLTNNYALDPRLSYATESTSDERFRQGVVYALITWGLLAIAVAVS
ncbi:MAG: hypothetical protein F6K19_38125 [Cyanothece sp. SIO1E1]|nr:hypothetical protein [Cyanothece sp. SIO1E1]